MSKKLPGSLRHWGLYWPLRSETRMRDNVKSRMDRPVTVLVIGALPRDLINFRGPLISSMLARGHRVITTSNGRDDSIESTLTAWGVAYHNNKIHRAGASPIHDFRAFVDLVLLIRRIKPERVLAYTIKPVVYGALAARCCGVPGIFAMIEGLGRAFMPTESWRHGLTSLVAKTLYRIGLPLCRRVFFLNPDDLNQMVAQRFLRASQAVLLDGIGIDLDGFPAQPIAHTDTIRFLMIARLLRDKGVMEYLEAGRKIREQGLIASCELVGDFDPNPSSLEPADLEPYLRDGTASFHGVQKNVRPYLDDCDVYVLPSFYREGTPRTVLEAMSTGRAIITTDAPGCRETVRPMRLEQRPEIGDGLAGGAYDAQGWLRIGKLKVGANGILIPVKDVDSLVQAMRLFIEHRELIPLMGRESRRYAEERYDVRKVNAVMLEAMGLSCDH